MSLELFACIAFHCKGNFDIFKYVSTKTLMVSQAESLMLDTIYF